MITMEDIRIIKRNKEFHKLGRSSEQEKKYAKHKKQIKSTYGSLENYLMEQVLDEMPIITKNAFPYYLADGINHYVVWFEKREDLEGMVWQDSYDYVTIEMPEEYRSVSGIRHMHIFTTQELL